MRNILALVGAATVAFLLVGWYLGWYQVSSVPSPHGPQSVQVDINPTKITEDVKKGVEKGGQIVDSLRDPTSPDGKPAPAGGTPGGPAKSAPAPTDPNAPTGGWRPIGSGSRPDADDPPASRGPRN